MSVLYGGAVILTWPKPVGRTVPGWGLTVQDADTGEQIRDATAMTIAHGDADNWDSGPVGIRLIRLVDEHGQPIGNGPGKVVPTDEYEAWLGTAADGDHFEGQRYRTRAFHYLIAEVRVGDTP